MDFDYFQIGREWPPKEEVPRLELYHSNSLLYGGEHALVHHDRWQKLFRTDADASYEIDINLNRRLSTLFADLLFSGDPDFVSTNVNELKNLLRLDGSDSFLVNAYEIAVDMSRFGVGIFRARHDGTRSVLEALPPWNWFPVVNPLNVKDIVGHIIACDYVTAGQHYLQVEYQEPGKLTTQVFALSHDNRIIGAEDEAVETETGVPGFLVFPCVNGSTSDSLYGKDDYSDVDSLIAELEVRHGQASRILDRNADPMLIGPRSAIRTNPITGKAYVEIVGGNYVGATRDDVVPSYVTWDGQLAANYTEMDKLMELFYMVSETGPAAFGKLESGIAESGSALRRLFISTLCKVKRMKQAIVPGMLGVLKAGALLDVKQKTGAGGNLDDLSIQMHDGIPVDPDEEATYETKLLMAQLTSRKAAIMRLFDMDDEAAQELIDQIAKETPTPAPPTEPL